MGLCLGGIPILITPICLGAKRLLHQVNRGILNTRPSNLFAWNDEETEEVDFTSMASLSPSSKQTRLRGYRVRWTQRTLTKALLLGSITLAVAIRRAFQHLCMGRKKVVLLEKKQANETIDMLCVCVCVARLVGHQVQETNSPIREGRKIWTHVRSPGLAFLPTSAKYM